MLPCSIPGSASMIQLTASFAVKVMLSPVSTVPSLGVIVNDDSANTVEVSDNGVRGITKNTIPKIILKILAETFFKSISFLNYVFGLINRNITGL
jgi:hypothetical protein